VPKTSEETDAPADASRYRLPRSAVPRHYDLTLEPDLAAATFTGSTDTRIEVLDATAELVLNAQELVVSAAEARRPGGASLVASAVEHDEELERVTLRFDEVLTPGEWVLHTAFTGVLNDKLVGFYRSTFTDTDGVEQAIATTQFEATHARKAFPCWDEPELKATFGVTLVVDGDLTAISNAAEVSRTPAPGRAGGADKVAVRFADTMVMSTYLVAFVIGPFEITDAVDVRGTPLRVVAPRGRSHLASYALEVGAFCLEYFEDYYGIAYPGDKCDLVAVPDFAFGAMENLGCITFREVLLLVEPEQVTQPELQNVVDVIAHELAHMWFGDLVTMRWWEGIWLNEAFATFMEMKACDAFKPDWDRWTSFGLSKTMAMDTDSLQTTRPIEYPVISPEEAEGMFDVLTYEKGAAVVRMLEQFLGEDRFRDGIRLYLDRHAYANTETTDLWDALEEATGEPVRRMMDSWIFQAGMPVVSIELNAAGSALRLGQERFAYLSAEDEGLEPDDDEGRRRWLVPVIFSQSRDGVVTFEKVLLDDESLDVAEYEPVDWICGNTEGVGFYRVRYSAPLLEALVVRATAELSPIERYGLVEDLWALVLRGELHADEVLDHLDHFEAETDLSVWQRIVGVLRSIDHLVDDPDARAALRARIERLLAPAFGWIGDTPAPDEGDRRRQLRGVLFEALGVLAEDAAVQIRARELHRAAVAGETVDPSLLAASINVIAATGGPDEFEGFAARFRGAATPQEEIRYLYALADFDDDPSIDRLAAMTLTDDVRTQNAPYLLRRALANRTQGERVWGFVRDHWDALNGRFPSNSIVRMLEGIRSLSRPAVADDVFRFFESHEVPQGDKVLAQHLERLEVNVALRRRESERLEARLR
jgi:puromycin-sensitive aminopeptidase